MPLLVVSFRSAVKKAVHVNSQIFYKVNRSFVDDLLPWFLKFFKISGILFDNSDPVESFIFQRVAVFSAGFSEIGQTNIVYVIQDYFWNQEKPPTKIFHCCNCVQDWMLGILFWLNWKFKYIGQSNVLYYEIKNPLISNWWYRLKYKMQRRQ